MRSMTGRSRVTHFMLASSGVLWERFGRSADSMPGGNATAQRTSVDPSAPQFCDGLAADLEPIDARHHDRLVLRNLVRPFRKRLARKKERAGDRVAALR